MLLFSLPIAYILASNFCDAWISHPSSAITGSRSMAKKIQTPALFSTVDDRKGKKEDRGSDGRSKSNDIEYDLEHARQDLEELMVSSSPYSPNVGDDTDDFMTRENNVGVLMTSAGRRRRQLEIDLLRQLAADESSCAEYKRDENQEEQTSNVDNDFPTSSVVDELMHLWMYEHGPEPAAQLEAMQEICTPGMFVEETQLRAMVDEFPTWAEPRARLAILLFMKGVSDESRDLALQALDLKPWHFDVYPVLIMIALRNQNMAEALHWARLSLPTHRPNSVGNRNRLKAWVNRALDQASSKWEHAEKQTIEQQHPSAGNSQDGDDCWQ